MKKSLFKDILRDIIKNRGQFISILLILALGVSFFIGISITGFYMRDTGNRYFAENNIASLQVTTSYGVNDELVKWLQTRYPNDEIEPVISHDALVSNSDSQLAVRLHANQGKLNGYRIIEGGPIQRKNEILLDSLLKNYFDYKVGSTLTMIKDDNLEVEEYRVVGFIQSVNYLSEMRPSTPLGDGTLDGYAVVHPDAFTASDTYNAINIRFHDLDSTNSYGDDFTLGLANKLRELNESKNEISQLRYDSIVLEPTQELKDAQNELDDQIAKARAEIAANQQTLNDKQAELDAAIISFNNEVSNLYQQLSVTPKIYSNHRLTASTLRREATALQTRLTQQLNEGLAQVQRGLLEISAREKELVANQQRLDENGYQLSLLSQALTPLTSARDDLNKPETLEIRNYTQAQIDGVTAAIASNHQQLQVINDSLKLGVVFVGDDSDYDRVLNAISALNQMDDPTISEAHQQVVALQIATIELRKVESVIYANRELNQAVASVYQKMGMTEVIAVDSVESVTTLETVIKDQQNQFDTAQRQLSTGFSQLYSSQAELQETQKSLLAEQAKMDAAFPQMNEGISQLERAGDALMNGQQEINDGQILINEALATVDSNQREGQAKIDEAIKELNDIAMPTTYILERSDFINGYQDLYNDSLRIEKIGQIFPLFFFLIAALVSLTTIRRMVEDQTQLMGVYKALGYSTAAIQSKYLLFSLTTLIFGLLLGAVLGYTFIPIIIFDAYRILYQIPNIQTTFVVSYFWIPLILSVLSTIGIAWVNSSVILRQSPASLMRPKAPPAGQRVFLERIGWLWQRLTFLQKVTIRNLARNKSRFLMTVVGIAGCMGLLVTGFGLNDSIMGIPEKQFNEFQKFDAQIIYDNEVITAEEINSILQQEPITNTYQAMIFGGTVEDFDVNVTIFSDPVALTEMYHLTSVDSKKKVALGNDGVVLTEKVATMLGLKIGDELTLINRDKGIDVQLKIADIVKNYALNYVYLSEAYASEKGIETSLNGVLVRMAEPSVESIATMSERVLQSDGILTIVNRLEMLKNINSSMDSFYVVIIVVIIAAGALALVVMYNLSSMNIYERERELATLKVLGFYPSETGQYISRENIVLVLLGILVGSGFGIALHNMVIVSVEIDTIMFVREIKWTSIALAAALTFLFALINELIMRRKINKIDMLSALKSVE